MSKPVFTNETVDEPSLPQASSLAYESLAPTYARTMIIEWLAVWVIIAVVNIGLNIFTPIDTLRSELWWVLVIVGLLAASVFLWAPMVANARGFALRERDIHYKSGIIWRKAVSLPFNRIQHVELESGPLERIFKLTTLKFFTAGGGSADMKIPALSFSRASTLRAFVMEKAGVSETGVDEVNEVAETHDNS